jgi:hypothetical protein
MPIRYNENQTVVHCTGDILVLPFSPRQEPCNGTAWLLLQEREQGKIGRKLPPSLENEEMCINGQPGVLIAADNFRSLDVVIEALTLLRNALAEEEIQVQRKEGLVPQNVELIGSDRYSSSFVVGINFSTIETHNVKGRGKIHVCKWPNHIDPFPLNGRVVVLDGDLHEVRSVESLGPIKKGQKIGLITRPFKKPIDEGLG